MKVDFLVIASGGSAYDAMKEAWLYNWESEDRRRLFPDSRLSFLYGLYASGSETAFLPSTKSEHDCFIAAEERVIPGILHKTLAVLKPYASLDGDDERWVVRTNLSSFYLWPELRAYLDGLERDRVDYAGFSDTRSHISGCNAILGPRAIARILGAHEIGELSFDVEDDLSYSKALMDTPTLKIDWAPRLDVLEGGPELKNAKNDDPTKVFHVRVKSSDRGRDANILRAFADRPDYARECAKSRDKPCN